MSKILVTGASGTIGSATVNALVAAGHHVLAATRNPETYNNPNPSLVQAIAFDFANPDTWAAAINGIDASFLLGPPLNYDLVSLMSPFIDFLKANNKLRIGYLAAKDMEVLTNMTFHNDLIHKLKGEGFLLTVYLPTFFAQNFKNYDGQGILEHNILFSPSDDGKAAFVDAHDIGAVIAKTLTESGHEGKEYALTGPEAYDYHEVADLLTKTLGKQITYVRPDEAAYKAGLAQAGAPAFVADYMYEVYSLVRDGHAATTTDHISQVLGRPATAFTEVLKRDFAV